jgi:Protein of unknown function (DUF3606)
MNPHRSNGAMPHDFLTDPIDRSHIQLVEDHELRFWTRELRCSAEHLFDAIEAVGVNAAAVGGYLAMRRHDAITMPHRDSYTDPARHVARDAFNENTLP